MIQRVMASAEVQMRNSPKDIKFDSIIVDLSFHPSNDIIAAGDIDGDITLHSYSNVEENREVMSLTHHKKACRCVKFSPDGKRLYSGSKDKSLCVVDMDKGAVSQHIKKAHSSPMYSMHVIDENIVATGDDEGNLKVWDLRHQSAVMDVKENDDFISDMVLADNKRVLLATSGDGTLSAFDIRKHKLKIQSELFDSEMLSLAVMKKGEKVVCGNGEGALSIFNWGEWGNISDRFPGHPMSIDCMVPFNNDILFTGSFDGIVRAVNILPNRFLGVVGEHGDFPVENMSLSHCRTLLASCSHDQNICFWNVEDVEKEKINTKRKAKKTNTPKFLNKAAAKDDFFAGLDDNQNAEQSDNSDDDDSDEELSDDGDEGQEHSENDSEDSDSLIDEDDKRIDNDDKINDPEGLDTDSDLSSSEGTDEDEDT